MQRFIFCKNEAFVNCGSLNPTNPIWSLSDYLTYLLIFCRGNLKEPGEKECVLIIDRHTGEITLEKLSGHMLLKKTRQATKQSAQIKSLVNNSGTIKIFI